MFKKIALIRVFLCVGLVLSIIYACWGIYYKTHFLKFSLVPAQRTPVWSIESHLSFTPKDEKIKVVFARTKSDGNFKVLDERIIAKGYSINETKDYFTLTTDLKKGKQNLYYRTLIYDIVSQPVYSKNSPVKKAQPPLLDDNQLLIAKELIELSQKEEGDAVQKLIYLLNQDEQNELVEAFVPKRSKTKEKAERLIDLLSLMDIPAQMIRGVILAEGKKKLSPDILIEVHEKGHTKVYDIETAKEGYPPNFIAFQKGDASLFDVEGGEDSSLRYSVLKSLNSTFNMAKYRAEHTDTESFFDYSIYNLPIEQQNALKWLMVFPLAILVVVILRNVIGIKTMGTFTPMLISMALVETGFFAGLAGFSIIVGVGLAIRFLLSKLNLLLVPRISAVVIFVILIIQIFSILGYQFDLSIASSALFFPIIIMAWIIERGSIIWEEEGLKSALKELFYSLLSAVVVYFIIVNETIRHIMFAFNELNVVILFIVMLLGTYTGYRLTELKRFYPLVADKKHKKGFK